MVYGPWGCGTCVNCREDRENYCQKASGQGGGLVGGHDGGMAEYLRGPAARFLIPLGTLDPRQAAPLSDAGLTSYHAVKRSVHLLGPGSTAVVIGVGGLGQMAIQMVRALSAATTVVAVDTDAGKLETAKRMGADEALLSGEEAVTRIKDVSTALNVTGPVPQAVTVVTVATVGGNVMETVTGAIAGPGRWPTAQTAAGVVTAVVPAPATVTVTGTG